MKHDDGYLAWLEGVGRQMEAARQMYTALIAMHNIESYDRIKCEQAIAAWEDARHPLDPSAGDAPAERV